MCQSGAQGGIRCNLCDVWEVRVPFRLRSVWVGLCRLFRPAQRDIEGWKSRISTRAYTDPGNPHIPPHVKEVMTSLKVQPVGIVQRTTDIHLETLIPHLCYMCHTTLVSKSSRGAPLLSGALRRSDGLVPLPVWVNARLRSHHTTTADDRVAENGEIFEAVAMDENAMKNALEGFLLSND